MRLLEAVLTCYGENKTTQPRELSSSRSLLRVRRSIGDFIKREAGDGKPLGNASVLTKAPFENAGERLRNSSEI